jgi:hypothetical protein
MEETQKTAGREPALPGTPPGCDLANYATRPVEFHPADGQAPGVVAYEGEYTTREGAQQFTLRVTGAAQDGEVVREYTEHLQVCIEAVPSNDETERALDALCPSGKESNREESEDEAGPTVILDINPGPDVPRPAIMHVLLDPYINANHHHGWVSAEWVCMQVSMGRTQLRGVAGADLTVSAVGDTGNKRSGGGCVVRGLAGRSYYRLYGGKHIA